MYTSTQNADAGIIIPKWFRGIIACIAMIGLIGIAQIANAEGLNGVLRFSSRFISENDGFLSFSSSAPNWNWHYTDLNREIDCLAKNIYFESAYEERQGQIAVGLVTINRVKSGAFADSICEVVWQANKNRHTGKRVAQFSWTLDRRPDIPHNQEVWAQCQKLAQEMLADGSLDNFDDFLNGATFYHAAYVHPKWRNEYVPVARIGLHIFYRSDIHAEMIAATST
jgi:hypothetical protein